jgi:hypothetical protein
MSGLSALSGSIVRFQRGGPDMSAPQPGHVWVFGTLTLVLVVQEKIDYSVSKNGLSGFRGFKPPDRTYPFTVFLTSHSLTLKNNREGDPKTPIGDPLIPPWNLGVLG